MPPKRKASAPADRRPSKRLMNPRAAQPIPPRRPPRRPALADKNAQPVKTKDNAEAPGSQATSTTTDSQTNPTTIDSQISPRTGLSSVDVDLLGYYDVEAFLKYQASIKPRSSSLHTRSPEDTPSSTSDHEARRPPTTLEKRLLECNERVKDLEDQLRDRLESPSDAEQALRACEAKCRSFEVQTRAYEDHAKRAHDRVKPMQDRKNILQASERSLQDLVKSFQRQLKDRGAELNACKASLETSKTNSRKWETLAKSLSARLEDCQKCRTHDGDLEMLEENERNKQRCKELQQQLNNTRIELRHTSLKLSRCENSNATKDAGLNNNRSLQVHHDVRRDAVMNLEIDSLREQVEEQATTLTQALDEVARLQGLMSSIHGLSSQA